MFARGVSSFYPPRLHASSCYPSKPFVSPTCRITIRNSFVSPTYAKTGGCTPVKMSARRHFLSLFSQSPLSALLLFNHLRTLSFSVSHVSAASSGVCALLRKNRGYPSRSYQFHSASSFGNPSPLATGLSPFTSHSQSCYRPFTHPSPSLVTIIPSQGTNSYTMPIAIRVPTVHFYRCDPPREIPS
jgi:hypothetical protein